MNSLYSRGEINNNHSLDNVNIDYVSSLVRSRPRPKNEIFNRLVKDLGDPDISEALWILYGDQSINLIDDPNKYLNPSRSWFNFWKKKNTVRSLVATPEGKRWVWQMLHDASAWL